MSLAGSFLVARPVLQDPNFARSVVLLLAHSADGAFGLVVNRPVPEPIEGVPFPVYFGGPCPAPGLLMLHGHPEWQDEKPGAAENEEESTPEIGPGIFVGDAACLERAREASEGSGEARFRVFSGYAGWAAGQLEGEIAAGAWAVVAARGPLLFGTPAGDLWDRLVPPSLPQPSVN
jgi:putative transcriptional regulator